MAGSPRGSNSPAPFPTWEGGGDWRCRPHTRPLSLQKRGTGVRPANRSYLPSQAVALEEGKRLGAGGLAKAFHVLDVDAGVPEIEDLVFAELL